MKPLMLIPFNCGWGASKRGCADGPKILRERKLPETLTAQGLTSSWATFKTSKLDPDSQEAMMGPLALPLVEDYNRILHTQVTEALEQQAMPLTLGGDHSMAVGTWSAVADYYDCHGQLGLIWIDAHLDAHPTVETSASKSYHGTPAATLMGHGEETLLNIATKRPVVAYEHICLIGIRSYEQEEYDFIQEKGVRIYMMEEIRERGMDVVMQEALARVTKGTKGFGVTIDLDAFDPSRAPGVGSPAEGGLLRKETLHALQGLGLREEFLALEIAEYNPHLGHDNLTSSLELSLIQTVFGK